MSADPADRRKERLIYINEESSLLRSHLRRLREA
jgi:hypothetical protein